MVDLMSLEPVTLLVIMWSMAMAEWLVTHVGYFDKEIILQRNMRLRKYCTFLFVSKCKKVMLKSPATTTFFRCLLFFENISLK